MTVPSCILGPRGSYLRGLVSSRALALILQPPTGLGQTRPGTGDAQVSNTQSLLSGAHGPKSWSPCLTPGLSPVPHGKAAVRAGVSVSPFGCRDSYTSFFPSWKWKHLGSGRTPVAATTRDSGDEPRTWPSLPRRRSTSTRPARLQMTQPPSFAWLEDFGDSALDVFHGGLFGERTWLL